MQIIRVIQVRYMGLRVNYKMYNTNLKLVIVFNIATIIPAMSVTTLLEIIAKFVNLHYKIYTSHLGHLKVTI